MSVARGIYKGYGDVDWKVVSRKWIVESGKWKAGSIVYPGIY